MENINNDLLSMSGEELSSFVVSLGEKPFRAKQLKDWMYKNAEIDEMGNLPLSFRQKLKENAYYSPLKIVKKLVSAVDGTTKYLFGLQDGNCIESVVMKYEYGLSICVSSQVGCRMGCKFCASTVGGKIRDLLPCEILGQIIAAKADLGQRISHIVMMGIGEPLDNYDNVITFLKRVNESDGLGIGYRNISLSTCGLVNRIEDLAKEDLPITLSISLHAPTNEKRSAIMPVNNSYGIDRLLPCCRDYFEKTGRRISFEYTLISGKNDDINDAVILSEVLKKYCKNMPLHVNLIPVNEVEGKEFKHSGRSGIVAFRDKLISLGVNATVRRSLGPDINAACGQLRRAQSENNEKNKTNKDTK